MYFKKILFIGLIMLGLVSSQTYYSRFLGLSENTFNGSTRSNAMGGASIIADGTAFWSISNPAALSQLKTTSIVISGQMDRYKENRSFPVHDFFGDYLVDASYVFNSNNYFDYGIAGAYSFDIGTLGFSFTPHHSFDYNYIEEVHDASYDLNKDPLVGYHIEEYSGTVQKATVSFGAHLNDYLSIGAGIHTTLDTKLKSRKAVIVLEESSNLVMNKTWDLSSIIILNAGEYYSLGFLAGILTPIQFSINYQTPLELSLDKSVEYQFYNGDSTTSFNLSSSDFVDYIIPESVKIGIQIKPRQEVPAELFFQYDWNLYSNLDSLWSQSINLKDEIIYRFGLETIAGNSLPIRVGMIYKKSPLQRDLAESIFTAGIGKIFGNFVLDISGKYSRISYSFEDQFVPDGDVSNPTGMETINETKIDVSCTIQYLFN